MSEQERKRWYVGDLDTGMEAVVWEVDPDTQTGEVICMTPLTRGVDVARHLARQIADDHNGSPDIRTPQLEERVLIHRHALEVEGERRAEQQARAERAEAALRVVWDAAYRVTETVVNGQPPDTKARWVCCGEYWHDPHKADCRHLALERALELARAALPQSEPAE